jgi:hypothetical protein
MKCAHRINRTFVYTNSAESSKPGYLQRKFALIRRQQSEQQAEEAARLAADQEAQANVRPIKQGAK